MTKRDLTYLGDLSDLPKEVSSELIARGMSAAARSRRAQNERILAQTRGMPSQPATPESYDDPRNPNAR